MVKSQGSQFEKSALCYPSWLREQFGRLESELNLVRNFVGKKIEDLEDLKSKYMIPDNLFERKVAEFEMHCTWNFLVRDDLRKTVLLRESVVRQE